MRGTWVILLSLLTLTLPLSGCIGPDDPTDANDEAIYKTRAQVDDRSGGIEGVVTDTAVQPIPNALVRLPELDLETTTAEDGSFAFSSIAPGEYVVAINVSGFVGSSDTITVRAGEVATIDFLLVPLASDLPFIEQFEIGGFMDYGWGLGWNVTGDAGWIRDSNCDYDAIANTKCRGEFELAPPLYTLVFDMQWQARGPLADKLQAMLRVSDNASVITGTWAFFRVEGPSPLHVRMDRADLNGVLERFRENCANGDDQFCGLSFRDEGWPLQTRVWPGWQCPTDTAGFCALVQQDYNQFVSAFYNAAAPVGFSVVEGAGSASGSGDQVTAPGPGPWLTQPPTATQPHADQPTWGDAGAGSAAPQPTSQAAALPAP